jgi:hypothetical protein
MICSSENLFRFIVRPLPQGRTLTRRGGNLQGQVNNATVVHAFEADSL